MPNLVCGVTKENFTELARTYSELGGVHFGVCLKPWVFEHEVIQPTIPQWGAWRWYRKKRKMLTLFMDRRAGEGKSFTVPAEWPHLFDSDESVQDDYEVGELFHRNYRPENIIMADSATRIAFITAMKLKFPNWHKVRVTPDDHLVIDTEPSIDTGALIDSHNIGMESRGSTRTTERTDR